jgi:hypothetical protein
LVLITGIIGVSFVIQKSCDFAHSTITPTPKGVVGVIGVDEQSLHGGDSPANYWSNYWNFWSSIHFGV